MLKKIISLIILFLLVAVATSSQAIIFKKSKKDEAPKSVRVEVAKVKQMTIPNEISALGSLVALKTVTVSSEVEGRVAKIFFKDGAIVGKGMPIVQLDNEQAKANYDSAVTALTLSKKKYQRGLTVAKIGAISQENVDTLKAQVESDKAKVKSMLAALNQKEIMSPFDGVLGAFKVQVGDYVNSGDSLVSLVNTDQLKAEYSVPENFKPELKLNQNVTIITSAYTKKKFYGTVTYIAPSVNEDTRSIPLQAMVNNRNKLLSPGMFIHVTQAISENKNALVVPEQAVSASIKGYQVYKVVNSKVALIDVQIGVRKNGMVQILKGLKLGDIVVTAGQQRLQDGSRIQIVS